MKSKPCHKNSIGIDCAVQKLGNVPFTRLLFDSNLVSITDMLGSFLKALGRRIRRRRGRNETENVKYALNALQDWTDVAGGRGSSL